MVTKKLVSRSYALIGMSLGIGFSFLSAAFDVGVGHLTQTLSPMIIGFYCFLSSALLFGALKCVSHGRDLRQKLQNNFGLALLLNVSVLMAWVGLFYALKFLEPVVVGVVSVALGPSLTLLILLITGKDIQASYDEKLISWLVLLVVFIMLGNSLLGYSSMSETSFLERLYGIVSILFCAIGMVSYTITSKTLTSRGWSIVDLLAVRNFLMVFVSFAIVYFSSTSFAVTQKDLVPIVLLVVLGHLVPIYMLQKAIMMISALQISIILLSLPVFTLFLQYFDDRLTFSLPTIISVMVILVLMGTSFITKFYRNIA